MKRMVWAVVASAVAACAPVDTAPDGARTGASSPSFLDGGGGYEAFRRSLNDTPWGIRLTEAGEPVRRGGVATRFEVRPGDCGADEGWSDCANDRERAELSGEPFFPPGGERWFAWSVYIPADYPDGDPVATTLGQIHQRGGPSGVAGGLPSYPPLLQFEVREGVYQLVWHRLSGDAANVRDEPVERTLARLDALRGRWADIVLQLDLDPEDGSVKVWLDGALVASVDEPPIRFRPQDIYFKHGVYRSFVSRYSSRRGAPLPAQIVYFDEVRTGPTREAVDVSVNPALGPVD